MATSLTATPVKHVGSSARLIGLPKIPQNTAAPSATATYPASTVMRRASNTSSNVTTPTWMAQAHSGGVKIAMVSSTTAQMSAYTVDPTLVDWPNVTLTRRRPQNPAGGIPRFTFPLGTATLKYSGTTFSTGPIAEECQLLLSGLNTWTEARKLPPLTPVNLIAPSATNIYFSITNGGIFDYGTTSTGRPYRWLGGSVAVTALVPTIPLTVNVYVVPITAGLVDDIAVTGVVIGTITTTPGVPTTRIFTAAEMVTATIVRWDQFWVVVARPGGAPIGSTSSVALYAPTDVPPPYDCPGVDCYLQGGFL